jgi:alpha-amylase
MVERCNAVGVNIMVDLVLNHMTGKGGSGSGTGGSSFDGNSLV